MTRAEQDARTFAYGVVLSLDYFEDFWKRVALLDAVEKFIVKGHRDADK